MTGGPGPGVEDQHHHGSGVHQGLLIFGGEPLVLLAGVNGVGPLTLVVDRPAASSAPTDAPG